MVENQSTQNIGKLKSAVKKVLDFLNTKFKAIAGFLHSNALRAVVIFPVLGLFAMSSALTVTAESADKLLGRFSAFLGKHTKFMFAFGICSWIVVIVLLKIIF